jgi:tetratricopeptide (TPR) repeat protein
VVRPIFQYRVFIASPTGLEEERKCFRDKLVKFTQIYAQNRGAAFFPVGWEDTPGGASRPQQRINEDFQNCDYAVFVLHNRWGTPTGRFSSGIAEEWALAEKLYEAKQLRDIVPFFKAINQKITGRDEQLEQVLNFKDKIKAERRYLITNYDNFVEFAERLETQLERWLRKHEALADAISTSGSAFEAPVADRVIAPDPSTQTGPYSAGRELTHLRARVRELESGFEIWMKEGTKLLAPELHDYSGALFCAVRAERVADSDIRRARARNVQGTAHFHLAQLDEAIDDFDAIINLFSSSIELDRRSWLATALSNKAAALVALNRSDEAVAIYDDLMARFGGIQEAALQVEAAKARKAKADISERASIPSSAQL